jgi:hypothetical protein
MFFVVGLSGCDNGEYQKQNIQYQNYLLQMESLRVGERFIPDRQWADLKESTTEFEKWRVYDSRPGKPDYFYITVKGGVVVSIWRGGKRAYDN